MIHIKISKLLTSYNTGSTEYATKEQFSLRLVVMNYTTPKRNVASANCIAQPLSLG